MIQGKWGNYSLEEIQKPQQQSAIPRNLGPAFSTTAGSSYYRNNKLPTPSFVGDKVVQATSNQQTKPLGPLSQFSNGMDATPENTQRAIELGLPGAVAANEAMNPERLVYGETPGSGYIYGGRDFMAKGSGPATGGFSRPSTADANLAFEDEQNRLVAEQSRQDQLRREYNDELQGQRNFDGNINWALNNPKAPGAAVYLAQLRQGRKIGQQVTPLSDRQSNLYKAQSEGFSKEAAGQNQLAEARTRQAALPYIGPSQEAENRFKNAQADYYQGRNATDRGNAMYEGYVKTLLEKMKASGTKALSATDWKALSDLQMTNPEMYAKAMADLNRQG